LFHDDWLRPLSNRPAGVCFKRSKGKVAIEILQNHFLDKLRHVQDDRLFIHAQWIASVKQEVKT